MSRDDIEMVVQMESWLYLISRTFQNGYKFKNVSWHEVNPWAKLCCPVSSHRFLSCICWRLSGCCVFCVSCRSWTVIPNTAQSSWLCSCPCLRSLHTGWRVSGMSLEKWRGKTTAFWSGKLVRAYICRIFHY